MTIDNTGNVPRFQVSTGFQVSSEIGPRLRAMLSL
jgi:hypothetical protein